MPQRDEGWAFHARNAGISGTFHKSHDRAAVNPDGSKDFLYMPKRDQRDVASRQLLVKRVPGRVAKGAGGNVYYVRMKKPSLVVGKTWQEAS